MKKILGILAIAATLTACNNEAGTTDRTKDSLDSVTKAGKDTVQAKADSTKDKMDTANKMQKNAIDTAAKVMKDTTKKM